jgi:hypothetical protein
MEQNIISNINDIVDDEAYYGAQNDGIPGATYSIFSKSYFND